MNDEDDFDERPTPGQRRPLRVLTDSDRERHRRSWVRGVPVVRPPPDEESTAPLELLLNGQLDVDDYAQVEALRRSSDDVYVLLMNLARAISRHRDKDRSGTKEVERQVVAAIDEQSKQMGLISERTTSLEDDNKETKRKLSFWQKVAGGAFALAIASSGGLLTKVWDRAGDEREATVERRYMKQEIERVAAQAKEETDRLSKQIDRLSRKDNQ